MSRKKSGRRVSALEAQAALMYREDLRDGIKTALALAPRRYRLLQWFAVKLRRIPRLGPFLERRRRASYEVHVAPKVDRMKQVAEAALPRRYRRALRGDAMVPSVKRP